VGGGRGALGPRGGPGGGRGSHFGVMFCGLGPIPAFGPLCWPGGFVGTGNRRFPGGKVFFFFYFFYPRPFNGGGGRPTFFAYLENNFHGGGRGFLNPKGGFQKNYQKPSNDFNGLGGGAVGPTAGRSNGNISGATKKKRGGGRPSIFFFF